MYHNLVIADYLLTSTRIKIGFSVVLICHCPLANCRNFKSAAVSVVRLKIRQALWGNTAHSLRDSPVMSKTDLWLRPHKGKSKLLHTEYSWKHKRKHTIYCSS